LSSDNTAVIDTGSALVGGPSSAVVALYSQIPGSQQLPGDLAGYYGFPCNCTSSVTMGFGGKSWPIDARDMNLGPISPASDTCVGGIVDLTAGSSYMAGGGGSPGWVVGATFLKNVYSVFRSEPAAIGFAELSEAAGGSSGTPTGS